MPLRLLRSGRRSLLPNHAGGNCPVAVGDLWTNDFCLRMSINNVLSGPILHLFVGSHTMGRHSADLLKALSFQDRGRAPCRNGARLLIRAKARPATAGGSPHMHTILSMSGDNNSKRLFCSEHQYPEFYHYCWKIRSVKEEYLWAICWLLWSRRDVCSSG